MQQYLAEVRRHPLLDADEEHALAVLWKEDGDREAARKLVSANLRLVVSIARRYERAFRNLLDLVQEGNIGLLEALKNFDPYRGVRFPSYAVWWIRAYVIRYVMNNWRQVKLGTTQAQRKLFFLLLLKMLLQCSFVVLTLLTTLARTSFLTLPALLTAWHLLLRF